MRICCPTSGSTVVSHFVYVVSHAVGVSIGGLGYEENLSQMKELLTSSLKNVNLFLLIQFLFCSSINSMIDFEDGWMIFFPFLISYYVHTSLMIYLSSLMMIVLLPQ